MDDNRRRAMYDGFNSVTLGHSKEWVRVAKQFMDLAFSGGPRVVKCPCTKCQNFKYVRKIEELEDQMDDLVADIVESIQHWPRNRVHQRKCRSFISFFTRQRKKCMTTLL
jgi:hypothetical protein